MNITTNPKNLLRAVRAATAFCDPKSIKVQWQFLNFCAESPSCVYLEATNSESMIRVAVEGCTVHTTGAGMLHPQWITELLTEFGGSSDIQIENDEIQDCFSFQAGLAEFQSEETAPTKGFPSLPPLASTLMCTIPAKSLAAQLSSVGFAAIRNSRQLEESFNYQGIVGVEFVVSNSSNSLMLAATNRIFLAYSEADAVVPGDYKASIITNPILPKAAAQKVANTLDAFADRDDSIEVSIYRDQSNLAFVVDNNSTILCAQASGRFPNWQALTKLPFTQRVEVEAGKLATLLRQAIIMAERDGQLRRVSIAVDVAAGTIEARAEHSMRGKAWATTQCVPVKGGDWSADINARSLVEVLGKCEPSKRVLLCFEKANGGAIHLDCGKELRCIESALSEAATGKAVTPGKRKEKAAVA